MISGSPTKMSDTEGFVSSQRGRALRRFAFAMRLPQRATHARLPGAFLLARTIELSGALVVYGAKARWERALGAMRWFLWRVSFSRSAEPDGTPFHSAMVAGAARRRLRGRPGKLVVSVPLPPPPASPPPGD